MPYRFATDDQNFADYSSGRVIYSLPGLPAFPVRLASELFLRAVEIIQPRQPLRLYDPCCGGAYHLAALGFLHGEQIESILASDVDDRAVDLARRNLALLVPAGLDQREAEIRRMLAEFGKASHAEALQSVSVLRARLAARGGIHAGVFQVNALDTTALRDGLAGQAVDLVISDIPYGRLTGWQVPTSLATTGQSPAWLLLESLSAALQPGSLVAIAADKGQKIAHERFRRAGHFQVGKRQVFFLTL